MYLNVLGSKMPSACSVIRYIPFSRSGNAMEWAKPTYVSEISYKLIYISHSIEICHSRLQKKLPPCAILLKKI